TCGKCHKENHSSWTKHPHSRMNMLAGDQTVVGDFSGTRLSYADGEVVFRKEADQFLMEYLRGGKRIRTFRVTRTIGWRYLQEYVGVQTQGPEPAGDDLYTKECRLKFGYVLKARKWLPQSYLDSPYDGSEYKEDGRLRYDPFDPERTPFNNRCIHCHNTYPYELRLYTDDRLQGFAPAPSRMTDALLKTRPSYLEQRHNPSLPPKSLVTVGISCESCHFGGREHAQDPRKAVRFVPTHPELAGWTPDPQNARKNPAIVNSLCRQCHFSGSSAWADGSAVLNSMESIEQDRGACKSQIRCIDCHNPHVRGPDAGAPDRKEHVAACVGCHTKLQSPAASQAHGRHDPKSASCLDCHMPRIVHGFDEMNRTHRISSPTEKGILESGMPNACNLCHLDRSLAWTRDALAQGWGKRIVLPDYLEEYFGAGHRSPAGEAWLAQPIGMQRVVAGAAYARSPLGKRALPGLLKSLEEPNAYVRARSLQNVERVLGRSLDEKEYNLTGPPEERRQQVQRLLKQYSD
ncbi:MAG TPA: ammonia-forming cytochrome c nitrite reductase subunit c552, partial [Planctomycetota bacterium]|nr:ammonia-forming cytochrome c nitrite reductase subunit c552 [Planctomycetota bacterium]